MKTETAVTMPWPTIASAARALARGEVSAEALTRDCLASLLQRDSDLHVVARLDPDRALAQAAASDARRRAGRALGPLDGIPLAHKDVFFRAGVPSASGSRSRLGFVPDATAHVIERLDAVGAVDLGRLNMVEIALGPTGLNQAMGSPRNPWSRDHIAGGSSSGSAVAIAAGLCFGGLGTDTGGSIRTPAACCGLVGLKPTFGAVSRRGVLPLSVSLDHVGVLARTVGDAEAIFAAIAGPDPEDPWSVRPPALRPSADIREIRVGVPEDLRRFGVVPEVAELLQTSVDALRQLGLRIVPVSLDWFEPANTAVNIVLASEAAAIWRRQLEDAPGLLDPDTRARLAPGIAYSAVDYIDALRLRGKLLQEALSGVFARVDMLHLPVLPIPVPTVAEARRPNGIDYLSFAYASRSINLLGLPALALPMGLTGNGLPNGFQLVGRPHSEALLLAIGRAHEAAGPAFPRPAPPAQARRSV